MRKERGDYMNVAHISYERSVTYCNPVSEEGRKRLEYFAKYDNMTRSTTQSQLVLKPIE